MAKITGITKTLNALKKLSKEADEIISSVIESTAYEVQKKAVNLAPADTGKLRQSIEVLKKNDKETIVQAGGQFAPYAPYIEWGTGGLVDVPIEFKDEAWLAKGRNIKQVNLHPRPFMYPAYLHGKKYFENELKKELDELVKSNKYN